jgi:hypothetical protein|tara:strand:- start:162 stop:278 length:117 start_codon:yes stop_codon:yes gene_type:complete
MRRQSIAANTAIEGYLSALEIALIWDLDSMTFDWTAFY